MDRANLSVIELPGTVGPTLALEDDIDAATVASFLAEIRRHFSRPARRLVLDFSGVRFCDSMGLSALIELSREAAATGVRVEVTNLGAPITRLLELTGLTDLFPTTPGPL